MLRRPHRFRSRTLTPSRNTPIFRHISKVFCRMFQFYCKFDLFMLFLFLDDIPFFCHDFFARNLMKARNPMKKRLISLLLAVAMMLAVVPTAAFAGDEASIASSKTLSITADGKPDVRRIVPSPNNADEKVYTGDGWKYEIHPENNNQDYLYIDKGYSFDLTNESAVKCYRVENYGEIQGGVFDLCDWENRYSGVQSGYVENFGTISGGIFLNDVRAITESRGVTYTPKITGGIFVNNPNVTNKCAIHVTNGGKIKKLKIDNTDSTEVAMDAANLYVVGTSNFDDNLKLTLDDGTVRTVTPDDLSGGGCDLPKHIPLTITEDGIPTTTDMTPTVFRDYISDDWTYDSVSTPENRFPIHLLSNFSGPVGPYPVKLKVNNEGTITDGIFTEAVSGDGTITGGIFLGTVATTQTIKGGVFVHTQVNGVHTVSSPAELGKIKTITLGNDAVTLDEPVDSFHFGGTPTNLSVTLEDGTVYHIDPSKEADGTVTLEPKPEEPDYYTVIVEGGEARNERGDILDSEVALTAGEKITLKLLDETQGEMVFSHWDVNNNDTDLADELAKMGFDQTAHETTFTMPAHDLTLTAKYRMPDEDAPQDDSFLMTAAAVTGGAVLTGLVVWQGYNIFSQVYLNAHLPEGTAIPANRQQLALLLWNTAGQPEASAASYVFPDVADPDVQTAARWATEQGLFKARKDGTFAPTDSVTTGQVYRAWQKVKTAG